MFKILFHQNSVYQCCFVFYFIDNTKISALLADLDALERVTSLLDDETPGVNSWPQFAQEFGITETECNALRPDGLASPTKQLITHVVQNNPKLTLKTFIEGMANIGRQNDIDKILKEFFDGKSR